MELAVTLQVLRPGLLTTVQDRGRRGLQHLGLVPGGPMDPVSHALANALVGNSGDEATLEITVLGPELLFGDETLIALCGGEFDGGLPWNRPLLVPAGSRLAVGNARRGARAYLAVAGGIAVAPVLGSRSTYLPGGFGGYRGRALRRGDELPLAADCALLSLERFARLKHAREGTVRWSAPPPTLADREPIVVHAIEGRELEGFELGAQRAFFDAVWRVAPESNRMGYRLQGPELARESAERMLSGPTCLGTVQVPAGGAPIALMADHQTTGGYPRIAEIASADVARVAQLAPGGRLHFARCTLETALELRRDARARLDAVLRGIAWEYQT